ncbi:MAG: hypothetical protein SGILL_004291, partial [Bacillariaceae sp.]
MPICDAPAFKVWTLRVASSHRKPMSDMEFAVLAVQTFGTYIPGIGKRKSGPVLIELKKGYLTETQSERMRELLVQNPDVISFSVAAGGCCLFVKTKIKEVTFVITNCSRSKFLALENLEQEALDALEDAVEVAQVEDEEAQVEEPMEAAVEVVQVEESLQVETVSEEAVQVETVSEEDLVAENYAAVMAEYASKVSDDGQWCARMEADTAKHEALVAVDISIAKVQDMYAVKRRKPDKVCDEEIDEIADDFAATMDFV